MARGAINVQITGDYDDKDVKRAIRDLQGLQSQSAPTSKSMDGVSAGLKKMALAAGAFVSVDAVVQFYGDAIQQGSSLQESLSKTEAVFGDNANAIKDWAKNSSTAFGQSQQQALEAAGTFGNLLQAFGVARGAATEMSQSMVQLAADLASFNNTSIDDAITALRSGLSGETEPLKRYGIALNDARLKAVALEQGLYSGKGALDVAAKSQAAYTLILRDSALAQGDFQRTSDGFANQMRILQASADNAKASIGIALVNAISDVTTAFGGAEGMGGALESVGQSIADAITGVGTLTAALADLVPQQEAATEETSQSAGEMLRSVETYQKFASVGMAGWQVYQLLTAYGREHREEQERITRVNDTAAQRYQAMSDAINGTAESTDELTESTENATTATDAFTESIKRTNTAISFITARNDLLEYLGKLKKELEGNKRTLDGIGPSALENQNLLVGAFGAAAKEAEAWAKKNGASATETQNYYDGLARKIVDNFVDQGFKRKDVMNWLNQNDIWQGVTVEIISKAEDRGRIAAHKAGLGIGRDLADGMTAGIAARANWVNNEAARLVINAERAARDAAQTQSPSKKFAKIGVDIVDGLIQGMKSKDKDASAAARETITGMLSTAESIVQGWDQRLGELKGVLDSAVQGVNEWASNMQRSLLSGFSIGSAYRAALNQQGELSAGQWVAGVDAQIAEMDWFGNVLQHIQATGGPNAQALVDYLATQGATQGGAMGQAMIDNGLVQTMADKMATVVTKADEVAAALVPSFLREGIASAQATYDGFRKNMGAGGPARVAMENLMDRLAASLNRTATVTVRTVYEAAGLKPRAMGGPVSANTAYLVGERGPEVLVMGGQSGSIIPNHDLSGSMTGRGGSVSVGGGGSTINLTVNAGMGTDGAEVGRKIIDAISAYERRNGKAYVAA